MPRLPDFIVIGAMKCATTSLHQYLDQHPQIAMSRPKELRFFVEEHNWHRGVDWYATHFDEQALLCGESSPAYTKYPVFQGAPKRMQQVVPHARLIYLVRDPIRRILSHYVHRVVAGTETQPLEQALADLDDNFYVVRSQYHRQLTQYLEYYSKDQILVVLTEDLQTQPRDVLRTIFTFLGADPTVPIDHPATQFHQTRDKRRPTAAARAIHQTVDRVLAPLSASTRWHLKRVITWPLTRPVERPTLSPELNTRLRAYLHTDVEALRAFTERPLSAWSGPAHVS
ncbi:MAG: sulfotransferase [Bacteroidota bacterium]